MKKTWVEIICDTCGGAEHFVPGDVAGQARRAGWIVTRKGKHFCSKACKERVPICGS